MAAHLFSPRLKATTAGLWLIAILFLVNAAISEFNSHRLAANDARAVQAQTALTTLEEVLATVTEAETRERGFIITGDQSYLVRYYPAVGRISGILDRLDQLIGDEPRQQSTLASLRKHVDARLDELAGAIAARKDGGFQAAQQEVVNNQGRLLMSEMRDFVATMQAHQQTLLARWTAESRRSARVNTATDLAGTLLGICTAGMAYLLFRREWRQRERADDALRRLAAIVESSDDAIVGETLDGTIVSWNAGAERIYGYPAAEAIGQSIFMICPPEVIAESEQNLEMVRQGARIEPFESQRVRKDGRKITVSLALSPIRDANGTVIGASRISRDITQQKLLQREVLEIAACEQRRIGQDLHDVAGQELTGLAMLTLHLSEELHELALPQADVAGKIVHGIEGALDQMRSLAKGLLPVVVDSDGLMAALSDLAAQTDDLSKVVCEFHCEEPVSIVDNQTATQLYRLAQEAVTNALKHARATTITIALKAVGDLVTLSIADDGRGLVVPANETRGSGLRIMRYRADLIGGRLDIGSIHPQGTVIACTLRHPQPARQHGDEVDNLVVVP